MLKIITITMIFIIYGYGLLLVLKGKSGEDPEILIGLGVILLLTVLACSLVFIIKKLIPDKKSKTLYGMETTIRDRLEELNDAMNRLDLIRPVLSKRENKVGHVANETLENAVAILNQMQQEYHVALWKIEILRLLNRYEAVRNPLMEDRAIDFTATEDGIAQLHGECSRLQKECMNSFNSNGRARLQIQLETLVNLIDNLRDAVIAGQISRTVQEIHPLGSYHGLETLKPQIESQIEFAHQFDILTAEFQLLESENIRLKSEQEVLKSIADQ